MTTKMMSFNKNPNIGLYGFITDKFGLIGQEVSSEIVDEIEKVLNIPIHKITIAGTSLIGVFVSGNSEKIIVPGITFERELKKLDDLKIKYEVLKTDHTCLGNNIVMNKYGAIINPEFTNSDIKMIEKALNIKTTKLIIANTETPGSSIIINDNKALVHRDASAKEINIIEKTLKVKAFPSTVNMGVPYVKTGILNNKNGMIIGESSGPAEIMNAEEELGYLD